MIGDLKSEIGSSHVAKYAAQNTRSSSHETSLDPARLTGIPTRISCRNAPCKGSDARLYNPHTLKFGVLVSAVLDHFSCEMLPPRTEVEIRIIIELVDCICRDSADM